MARRLISAVFLGAAIMMAGISRSPAAPSQAERLAKSAYEILNGKCYRCHGANGIAMKNVFVLDRERLVSSRAVVPGDPNSLLLKVIDTDAMPMGGPPLSQEDKATLKEWVMKGAPHWGPGETGPAARPLLSESIILKLIQDDLLTAPPRTRPFLRYFSLAHLYNAAVPDPELDTYRNALSKLLNSLSWKREIALPAAIDPSRTIYRVDLRDYNWTIETWNEFLAVYPYTVRTDESRLIAQLSGSEPPYLRADWFAANASISPLYYDTLGLPRTVQDLERQLGIDVRRDLEEEKNVARAGLRSSGVSQNNRVLERHSSPSGAYWKSFDFKTSVDAQNIFKDPIKFRPSGGEIIYNLPNAMEAYFLADSLGRRLDEAPIGIVSDRNNPGDPVIRNGRSCMSCHYAGIQGFQDDMLPIVSSMAIG